MSQKPPIRGQGRLFKSLPPGLEESRASLVESSARNMFSSVTDETFTTLKAAIASTSNYYGEVAGEQLALLEKAYLETQKDDFSINALDDETLHALARNKLVVNSLQNNLTQSGALILNPEAEQAAEAINRVQYLSSNVIKEAAKREIQAREQAQGEGQSR